ncbi:hypothetical protein C8Q80DRAFT_1267063 [Daedaleopsis nitida]|nr:hypothetical protein C8Q80DRAFT_1267063 [Daedaleopsis nitida]
MASDGLRAEKAPVFLEDVQLCPALGRLTAATHFLRIIAPSVQVQLAPLDAVTSTRATYVNPYEGQKYAIVAVGGTPTPDDRLHVIFPDFHLFDGGPCSLSVNQQFYLVRLVSFSGIAMGRAIDGGRFTQTDEWFLILRCVDEQLGCFERVGWAEIISPLIGSATEFVKKQFIVV